MSIIRKTILGTALAASALAATTPAMARDYYYRGHNDTAAVAIGAGVIGLALGAIIASSNDHDHDRYRDRYYDSGYAYGPAYTNGWQYRDGWYWDRDGRRHDRDEYYRYHQNDDWRRGYDHDRGDWRRGF